MIWQGQVAGVEVALDTFKAEKAFPICRMHEVIVTTFVVFIIIISIT